MSRPTGSKNKVDVAKVEAEVSKERLEDISSTGIAQEVNSTTIPIEKIKIVDNTPLIEDLKNQIVNLESRMGEIEGFRNPAALDTRVQHLQALWDEMDGRLQKVEALLRKAYALEDNMPDIVKLKGNPGTANLSAVNAVNKQNRGVQDGVPKPDNAPKVSI